MVIEAKIVLEVKKNTNMDNTAETIDEKIKNVAVVYRYNLNYEREYLLTVCYKSVSLPMKLESLPVQRHVMLDVLNSVIGLKNTQSHFVRESIEGLHVIETYSHEVPQGLSWFKYENAIDVIGHCDKKYLEAAEKLLIGFLPGSKPAMHEMHNSRKN